MIIEAYGLSISIRTQYVTITRYVDSLRDMGPTLHYYQAWWGEFNGDSNRFVSALLSQSA